MKTKNTPSNKKSIHASSKLTAQVIQQGMASSSPPGPKTESAHTVNNSNAQLAGIATNSHDHRNFPVDNKEKQQRPLSAYNFMKEERLKLLANVISETSSEESSKEEKSANSKRPFKKRRFSTDVHIPVPTVQRQAKETIHLTPLANAKNASGSLKNGNNLSKLAQAVAKRRPEAKPKPEALPKQEETPKTAPKTRNQEDAKPSIKKKKSIISAEPKSDTVSNTAKKLKSKNDSLIPSSALSQSEKKKTGTNSPAALSEGTEATTKHTNSTVDNFEKLLLQQRGGQPLDHEQAVLNGNSLRGLHNLLAANQHAALLSQFPGQQNHFIGYDNIIAQNGLSSLLEQQILANPAVLSAVGPSSARPIDALALQRARGAVAAQGLSGNPLDSLYWEYLQAEQAKALLAGSQLVQGNILAESPHSALGSYVAQQYHLLNNRLYQNPQMRQFVEEQQAQQSGQEQYPFPRRS